MQRTKEDITVFNEEEKIGKPPMRFLRTLTATGQSAAEEILPDYRGEIRRVLLEEAEVICGESFRADAEKCVEGNVQYRLYYLDGNDKLCVAEFSSEYAVPLPLGDGERVLDGAVNLVSFSVRPVGPRKIAAKANLFVTATVCKEKEEDVRTEGKIVPETQTKTIRMADFILCDPTEREYAEQAEILENVLPSEVEIVTQGGSVRVLQAKATADGVLLSGMIDLSCIIRVGEGTPYAVGKSLPFEELIPYGMKTDAEGRENFFDVAKAEGVLTSVRVDATVDPQNEQNAALTVSAIAQYRAGVYCEREALTVTDAYAVGGTCRIGEEEITYEDLTAKGSERLGVTASADTKKDENAAVRAILHTYAYLPSYEAEPSGDGVRIHGKIVFFAITDRVNEDGAVCYSVERAEAEFDENVKISGQIEQNSYLIYRVNAENVSSVLNGDNIDFSADLKMEVFVFTSHRDRRITDVTTEENTETTPTGVITVFYPDKNDTLWNVAKTYGKSVETLAAENRLTEEQTKAADTPASLAGVAKLMIL